MRARTLVVVALFLGLGILRWLYIGSGRGAGEVHAFDIFHRES